MRAELYELKQTSIRLCGKTILFQRHIRNSCVLQSDPKSGQHQHPNLCYISEQEKCWVTWGQGLTVPFAGLQVPKQQGGRATITHHNIFS